MCSCRYLIIQENSSDDPLVRLEQSADNLLIVGKLDVAHNSSSGKLGLLESILHTRVGLNCLLLAVDKLESVDQVVGALRSRRDGVEDVGLLLLQL